MAYFPVMRFTTSEKVSPSRFRFFKRAYASSERFTVFIGTCIHLCAKYL